MLLIGAPADNRLLQRYQRYLFKTSTSAVAITARLFPVSHQTHWHFQTTALKVGMSKNWKRLFEVM